MRTPKLGIALIATTALLTAAGAAGAAVAGGGPSTEPVSATFKLNPVDQTGTECIGADGTYFQGTYTSAGPIKSAEPRIAGKLVVVQSTLENETTGSGIGSGTFQIVNPHSGSVKVKGTFTLVGTPDGARGTAVGTLANGSVFAAAFSTLFDPNTGVTKGEFGAPNGLMSADPAFVQAGGC
jgi:hypothetical protein